MLNRLLEGGVDFVMTDPASDHEHSHALYEGHGLEMLH